MAVSYSHLDVYKRQVLRWREGGRVDAQRGVLHVPDRVRLALCVKPVDLQQVGGDAGFAQALAQGALQCKDDECELVNGVAD